VVHTYTHTHTLITSDFTIGGDELWVGGEKLFESGGIRGNNNNHNRNYNNNNNHLVHYYTLWQKNPQKVREQVDKSQWQTPPSSQEHSHKEFSL